MKRCVKRGLALAAMLCGPWYGGQVDAAAAPAPTWQSGDWMASLAGARPRLTGGEVCIDQALMRLTEQMSAGRVERLKVLVHRQHPLVLAAMRAPSLRLQTQPQTPQAQQAPTFPQHAHEVYWASLLPANGGQLIRHRPDRDQYAALQLTDKQAWVALLACIDSRPQ